MNYLFTGEDSLLPDGWKLVRMADVVRETQYGTSERANSEENGLPVLRMNNITYSGHINLTHIKWCPITEKDEEKFTVRRGDLLFNRTNSPELVGKTAVWESDEKYAFAGYLIRVRFKPELALSNYVSTYLNSPYGKTYLFNKAKPSINMSNISASEFLKIPLPLPPLEEQRRIATILDKADAVRRKRKEAIALTEELLRSAFLEMFGDPVTNPKGWEVHQLGQLAHVTDGTHKTPTYIDSGVPFLSARNIRAHKIDWDNTRFISQTEHESLIRRCYPKRGDVLLTKSGTIGEAAAVDRDAEFSLFESVALLRVHNDLIDPVFLATLLNDHRVRCRYGGDIKGIAVKHLHLVDIKRVPVIVPPRKVQNMFFQQATGTRKHRSMLVRAHEVYESFFNSLLQRAFRGEL